MNNFSNPFTSDKSKLVNYNATQYENKKVDDIINNKMNLYNNKINNINKPVEIKKDNPIPNKELEIKSRLEALNRMRRNGN